MVDASYQGPSKAHVVPRDVVRQAPHEGRTSRSWPVFYNTKPYPDREHSEGRGYLEHVVDKHFLSKLQGYVQ